MSEVVLLVLRTGEHIMGSVIGELDQDELAIDDMITFAPNSEGTGVAPIPYLQLSEETAATFSRKQDIRHILHPKADLLKFYNTHFSKIEVPDSNIILG